MGCGYGNLGHSCQGWGHFCQGGGFFYRAGGRFYRAAGLIAGAIGALAVSPVTFAGCDEGFCSGLAGHLQVFLI
jgi:hypothetical protein